MAKQVRGGAPVKERARTTVKTDKYTDQQYIDHDPFAGDRDVDVRARKVKIVTTRKPQICTDTYCRGTEKPAGTRMRRETAVVDGEWCTSYACLECIARWFDEEPGAVPAKRKAPRRRRGSKP